MIPLDSDNITELLLLEPGWRLNSDGSAVFASIEFSGFAAAWGFMTEIAVEAEKLNHHPEWSNVFNRVDLCLTTHDLPGLSSLDLDLARKIATALRSRPFSRVGDKV